ncbi:MAG: type II toxin-antitoxin system RelE/ParE family toxin [Endozoicomonas sp.]|uniref:type II toxin-antitoxin system RelE/ParE family toxin n=1 Tax=Endozoicomonas sp. TaxID=1892382 RepID=UPI003D9BE6DD
MTNEFQSWFLEQDEFVQLKIREVLERLKMHGPQLGRPDVDTLYGSDKVSNLKELRVNASSRPYRIFFTFNPNRDALVLCAGVKDGANEKKFYKKHIKLAEKLFEEYTR